MNRAQRRAAERTRSRQQAQRRIERPLPFPMIVKMGYVLAPLEAILDQIENDGTVDVGAGGVPIFRPPSENCWYSMSPAIEGMADYFEMWGTRHRRQADMRGLRQLASRLQYGMPITDIEIAAARRCMDVCRRIAAVLSHDDAEDLLQQTRIKDALDTKQAGV